MYNSNYNDFNNDHREFGLQDPRSIEATDFLVEEPDPEKKTKKRRLWPKVTALCLTCAIVGGLAGGGAIALWGGTSDRTVIYQGESAPTVVTIANVNNREKLTAAQIYATYVGSTVGITTEISTTNIFGQSVQNAASGSGFVVSSDGYIITNYHVIEGASSIKVTFMDGKSYDATLRGGDEENDIAVLKIDATELSPLVIGNSGDLVVGDTVYAIGNPLGELTYSMTGGMVSALDRNVTMSDGRRMNYIQTDTAINSGNSGGALFNQYGEVVGIVSAKLSSSGSSASVEGLGFAIPLDDVKNMLTDIIQNGYVTGKPYMGIIGSSVSGEAQRYGTPAGAYIQGVVSGSCSGTAGLQAGDIITKLDDVDITSMDDLENANKTYKAGDTVSLSVIREGKSLTLSLTFDEKTAERESATQKLQEELMAQQQQQYQQQYGNSFNWPFN